MKIACATCGFEAEAAEVFATHMVTTGHGMSAGVAADVKDSGFFAEIVEQLRMIQGMKPEHIQVDPRFTPVDEYDPDLPQEVLDGLKAIEERKRNK